MGRHHQVLGLRRELHVSRSPDVPHTDNDTYTQYGAASAKGLRGHMRLTRCMWLLRLPLSDCVLTGSLFKRPRNLARPGPLVPGSVERPQGDKAARDLSRQLPHFSSSRLFRVGRLRHWGLGPRYWLGSRLSSEPRGLTGQSVTGHAGVLTVTRSKRSLGAKIGGSRAPKSTSVGFRAIA